MATIQASADFSGAISELQKMLSLSDAQVRSFEKMTQATLTFSTAMEAGQAVTKMTGVTLTGLISANERVTAILKQQDGQWQAIRAAIDKTTDAQRRNANQARMLATPTSRQFLDEMFNQLKGASLKEANQFRRIQERIFKLDPALVEQNIGKISKEVGKGQLKTYVGDLAKLRDYLVQIAQLEMKVALRLNTESKMSSEQIAKLAAARQAQAVALQKLATKELDANTFIKDKNPLSGTGRTGFNIFDYATQAQRTRADALQASAARQLQRGLASGAFTQDEFKAVRADVMSTDFGVYEGKLGKLQDTLRRVRDAYNAIHTSAKKAIGSEEEKTKLETMISKYQALIQTLGTNTNKGFGNSFANIDVAANPKLAALSTRIAQVGAKAKLTEQEITALYTKLGNKTALTAQESKYSQLIGLMNQYLKALEAERVALARNEMAAGRSVNAPSNNPAVNRGLLPNHNDLNTATRYDDVLFKIRNSLDYFLIYKGFNYITQQINDSIKQARELQIQISLIRTVSQESQLSMQEWGDAVRRVSSQSGLAASDVAKGFYDAVQNQVAQGRAVEKFAMSAADLSRTTGSSLQETVNVLSSSINSYRLSAEDAEGISAKLFRAVDLGRFKIQDISNTFGRVAFVGKDLGVTFEEILAVLSSMTRRGVTLDDSMTLLTNGMSKLVKPTEAGAKLLRTWGFESGEAAVRSRGFYQLLVDIIAASERGEIALSEFFNEIRGDKFIRGLRGGMTDFVDDLTKIRDTSREVYEQAKNIRAESSGDTFNKLTASIENKFTANLGNAITDLSAGFVNLTLGIDGTAKAVTSLGVTIGVGVAAYTAYHGTVLAGTLAKRLWTLATVRSTQATLVDITATNAATVATGRLTLATRGLFAVMKSHPLAIAAGLAAIVAELYLVNRVVRDSTKEMLDATDLFDKIKDKRVTTRTASLFDPARESSEKYTRSLQVQQNRLAELLQTTNSELEITRDRSKEAGEALRSGFNTYLDRAKDSVNAVTREIGMMDDRIKRSNRSALDFRNQIDSILYATQRRYANPDQQEGLIEAQITRLKKKVGNLYAEAFRGDPETSDAAVAEARQVMSEIIRLREEKFNAIDDNRKFLFERNLRMNPRDAAQMARDSRGNIIRPVDTSPLQKELQRDAQEFEAWESMYRRKKRTEEQGLRETESAGKTRLKTIQEAIEQLNKIKIFDEGGNIFPQFQSRTSTKGVDVERVREAYSQALAKIQANIDNKLANDLGLTDLVTQRVAALEAELAKISQYKNLTQLQNELNKAQREGPDAVNALAKAYTEQNQAIEKNVTNLRVAIDLLSKYKDAMVAARGTNANETSANYYGLQFGQKPVTAQIAEIERRNLILGKQAKAGFLNPRDLADQLGLIEKLQADLDKLNQFAKPGTEVEGRNYNEIKDALKATTDELRKQAEALQIQGINLDYLKRAHENIQKITEQTPTDFAQMGLAGAAAFKATNQEAVTLENTLKRILDWIKQIDTIKGTAGTMERKAYGGPVGSDNKPAWLTAGESVNTVRATQQFGSQIAAMNSAARIPDRFNQSISVNTTINESNSPQMTAREIIAAVKREIRRGA